MMKTEIKKEIANTGRLKLDEVVFAEDCINVSIGIEAMSDALRKKVEKAIEIAKVDYTKEREVINAETNSNFSTAWSDKPVVINFTYLSVILEAGKPIKYSIDVGFHDADNKRMECWDCSITVDLSEHESEIKKIILNLLIDRFF